MLNFFLWASRFQRAFYRSKIPDHHFHPEHLDSLETSRIRNIATCNFLQAFQASIVLTLFKITSSSWLLPGYAKTLVQLPIQLFAHWLHPVRHYYFPLRIVDFSNYTSLYDDCTSIRHKMFSVGDAVSPTCGSPSSRSTVKVLPSAVDRSRLTIGS